MATVSGYKLHCIIVQFTLQKIIQERLKILDKEYKGQVCGSYRRGAKSSGDIDILLSHSSHKSGGGKKVGIFFFRVAKICVIKREVL